MASRFTILNGPNLNLLGTRREHLPGNLYACERVEVLCP
jgi:3-dehydroquinate dehydratase